MPSPGSSSPAHRGSTRPTTARYARSDPSRGLLQVVLLRRVAGYTGEVRQTPPEQGELRPHYPGPSPRSPLSLVPRLYPSIMRTFVTPRNGDSPGHGAYAETRAAMDWSACHRVPESASHTALAPNRPPSSTTSAIVSPRSMDPAA